MMWETCILLIIYVGAVDLHFQVYSLVSRANVPSCSCLFLSFHMDSPSQCLARTTTLTPFLCHAFFWMQDRYGWDLLLGWDRNLPKKFIYQKFRLMQNLLDYANLPRNSVIQQIVLPVLFLELDCHTIFSPEKTKDPLWTQGDEVHVNFFLKKMISIVKHRKTYMIGGRSAADSCW